MVLLRIGLPIPLEMWGIDGLLPLRLLESLRWDLRLMWLELRLLRLELRLLRRELGLLRLVLRMQRLVLRLVRLHLGLRLERKVLHTRRGQSLERS